MVDIHEDYLKFRKSNDQQIEHPGTCGGFDVSNECPMDPLEWWGSTSCICPSEMIIGLPNELNAINKFLEMIKEGRVTVFDFDDFFETCDEPYNFRATFRLTHPDTPPTYHKIKSTTSLWDPFMPRIDLAYPDERGHIAESCFDVTIVFKTIYGPKADVEMDRMEAIITAESEKPEPDTDLLDGYRSWLTKLRTKKEQAMSLRVINDPHTSPP